MENKKGLRGLEELIKRLNLGIIAAMEVETLELDEEGLFLSDLQHLETTTTKLINDLIDAVGIVTGDVVTEYLKNSNLYLRSAKRNLGGMMASGTNLKEQTDNLRENLIRGFASYVMFAMANATNEIVSLTESRLSFKEGDLEMVQDLLDELNNLDTEVGITEKYGGQSYYEDKGVVQDFSGVDVKEDDDMEDEVEDDEEDEELEQNKLSWDLDATLDLGMFKEKRD